MLQRESGLLSFVIKVLNSIIIRPVSLYATNPIDNQ